MKINQLPKACIVVVDPDKSVVRSVTTALKQRFDNARLMGFTDPNVAWRSLHNQKHFEPKLIITDTVGVFPQKSSLAQNMRTAFPRSQILLFSDRTKDADIINLQNEEQLINRYVSKNKSVDQLSDIAFNSFSEYERHPVLNSIRQYVAECKLPSAPFMGIETRNYSLIDVYWEIVIGSPLGKIMEEVWLSLLLRATSLKHGQVK